MTKSKYLTPLCHWAWATSGCLKPPGLWPMVEWVDIEILRRVSEIDHESQEW
ncbi:uncharacterized protein BDV17DRAFT_253654 [Aspergillus undulatus]|uniref:uncharacterized protein n=1 Tax=Aspergillus undulatus TaxID=1810928 RepID=UPI003CCDA896